MAESKWGRPVTVGIICFNEEAYIERCLLSVSWADEILLIDSMSTDNTMLIAKAQNKPWSEKIRILERKWTGFRDQRNFLLENTSNDYVLVVDADEACSPELAREVRKILAEPKPYPAFKVRRIEYFLGKEIRGGMWNPSYQDRFFHRQGVSYINDIHEYPKFSVEPRRIEAPLYHRPDFNIEMFLAKLNKYTSIEARDRYADGQRTHLIHVIGAYLVMFFRNFLYYKSYRDGYHGLIISVLEGISRAVRHVKLWQLEQQDKKKLKKK